MPRKSPRKPRQVFISHSSEDSWVAKQIARHVTAAGAKPFLDNTDIAAGMDFEKEIFSFLAKADELLVLLTRPAVKSHFVFLEIGAARVRNLTIAGILYGITARDLQSMPGIPSVVKELNLLDINQVEKYFEQLAKRCSTRPKTPKKS